MLLSLLALMAVTGLLRDATVPARGEPLPANAESARVAAELRARPGSDVQPVILVATRDDGAALSSADRAAVARLTAAVTAAEHPPVGPPEPTVSADGRAATTMVPIRVGEENADNIATIDALRKRIAATAPAGLAVQVTGGPAFGADIADAFSGADLRLLAVTIGIVALLLLVTYRSPTLWLIPLTVVGLADQLAAAATRAVGQLSGLYFDAGIVSVLVFGAGTNYALLLISRYREELRREPDHRIALASARRATLAAVVASNVTVVLALLTLLLAVVPATRGLGLAGATGLVIALLAIVFPLPAALSLVGRKVFWPFIPRPGEAADDERSVWWRLGAAVTRRPLAFVIGAALLLVALAATLTSARIGLTQSEQFRVASESQQGLAVVEQHFPAGSATPLTVIVERPAVGPVTAALREVPGVTGVTSAGQPVAGRTVLSVVGDAPQGSAASRALVEETRRAVHAIPNANALVGGSPASAVDARAAADRDLRVVAPMVLGLVAVVLMVLLRALVGPLVLLGVNVLSALATIGAGAWVGRVAFGFPALDVQVPLIAFLFLIALGVDYTIFLVHRAEQESPRHGIRVGVARAVGTTGAVITSAGIVLAGVFVALGVLPLVVLGQLGLIVGLGVLVDTFVVRALLVPGLFALLGERVRWPRRIPSAP